MVLSGTADELNSVYDSIDEITKRIPKKLTYPILIELCKYGNLGKLDLTDIVCEGQGCLEVVNRNFGLDYYGRQADAPVIKAVSSIENVGGDATYGITETTASSYVCSGMWADVTGAASVRSGANCFNVDSWNLHKRAFLSQDITTEQVLTEPSFFAGSSLLAASALSKFVCEI